MDNPENPPFPVSRFTYYGNLHYYYPYGNTPAEDFLENVTDVAEPAILLLGCGDIRSCFYTLWKNFTPEYSGRFNGVRFVLNDYCAAVLARNILFLYLCSQVPNRKEETQKWIAALWDIWFCHELHLEHKHVLKVALCKLLRCSRSLQAWSESAENPLCNIVRFTSEATLTDIMKVWKMWYNEEVQVGSVDAMKSARKKALEKQYERSGSLRLSVVSAVGAYVGLLSPHIPTLKRNTMEQEVSCYLHSGSAYAESVLHLPLSSDPKSVNLTLFDRANGTYTMHYGSVPYTLFFHAFQFSPKEVKKAGIAMLDQLIVEDEAFVEHPLLANSVQQFTLWLVASAKLLLSASKKQSNVSFTFQCSHAVEFCQQLQQSSQFQASCLGSEQGFDLIYSSNLLDHLAPPNLVLTALPLLKKDGLLFTCAFRYKNFTPNSEKYLEACFGFESKLLPIICGTRCIDNDGEYASPISLQPIPANISRPIGVIATPCTKLLIWKRISALPFHFTELVKESVVMKALSNSISVMLTSFFGNCEGLHTLSHLCTGSAIAVLQSFASRLDLEANPLGYQFWSHLCSHLRSISYLRPFLVQLQTLAHHHGLHLHLTVSETDCSLCNQTVLSGQFSIELSWLQGASEPKFIVCIHKSTTIVSQMAGVLVMAQTTGSALAALSDLGEDIHLIDSVAGRKVGDKLKLDFFAPQSFATDGYQVLVLRYETTTLQDLLMNVPTVVMQGKLADYSASGVSYTFKQPELQVSTSKSTLGILTQHSGNGNQFESLVSISDDGLSALESSSLRKSSISDSEIEISCEEHSIQISYPYPVDYHRTKVKLSRRRRTITVVAPRDVHHFYNEKPVFVANPDNGATLPPMLLSPDTYCFVNGMQFTKEDRLIMEKCNREPSLMPTMVNLKESMNFLHHCVEETFFEYHSSATGQSLGIVIVHHRVFDLQRNTPAADLSFCFLEGQSREQVLRKLIKIIPPGWRKIPVEESEYDVMRKVFNVFASRTVAMTMKKPLIGQHKLPRYFTRAVIYPLYPDPDLFIQEIGIDKVLKTAVSEADSTLIGANDKCSFCDIAADCLKKCGGCGNAQYCGRECQKQHWKVHKASCWSLNKGNDDSKSTLKPPVMPTVVELSKCESCGREASSLKRCRCHLVAYCGIECQRNDWPKHRANCTSPKK